MHKLSRLPVLISSLFGLALLISFTGCSPKAESGTASSDSTTTTTGSTPDKKMTVGVVFDSGGIGDHSFNDSANAGLQKAKKDFGIDAKTVESKSEQDYATNIEAMADGGCQLVFAVGLAQENALKSVAPKFPNVKFAIVDGETKGDNVRSLRFDEEQGSFLAGYLAAMMSTTKKIGFVGGQKLALIEKFYDGYVAGAKTADPTVEVFPAKYVGSWDNVDGGYANALQLYGTGADVVYHAAGRAGLGVLKAASEQKKYGIGVDSDQDGLYQGYVLTSMIKRVDNAVYQTIKDVQDGKFQAGDKVYDLKAEGVGLSPFTYTKDKIGADKLGKLKAVSDDIVSGKIKVPSTPAELDAYLATLKR